MSRRYSTADEQKAQAAAAFLRNQGFHTQAGSVDPSRLYCLTNEATVEALELLLRRAPSARPIEDEAVLT
jgi:hypothetical protein